MSWGGTLLWNGTSARLPTSLAGQLVVSEILAGLLYVFVADGRVPSVFELAGILAVVSGVLVGIRRTSATSREVEQARWSMAESGRARVCPVTHGASQIISEAITTIAR